VRAEYASAAENRRRGEVFGSMSTGGSRSVRGSQEYLRKAGAVARELLIAAAARRWQVPGDECIAADSRITHEATGRSVTYGAVAAEAARLDPPELVFLKDPQDWKLLGRRIPRLDVPDKVAGKPVFGTDVDMPGLLHAAVQASPVFGGRLKGYQKEAVRQRPGVVQVVGLEDAVAVVAEGWWQAQQALAALPVEWSDGGTSGLDDAGIRAKLEAGLTGKVAVGAESGEVDSVFRGGHRTVEHTFYAPYLAHATMEPMTCTARVEKDEVEIWVPTQNASAALTAAARTAGVDPARVKVHNTQLGGGFGRRGAVHDFVEQAVTIAKAVGRPVKLIWSREEDMQHDFYRPASMARLSAALDAEGHLAGLKMRVAAPSILASLRPGSVQNGLDPIGLQGLADLPYGIPHLRAEYSLQEFPVPVGFWRSVNHSQNAFFRECFLDRVAREAGVDPYAFRHQLLAEAPKQRRVLEVVAKRAGWGSPLPEGTFRGIALETSYGSHCAQVAELELKGDGRFRLKRVVCAIDPGHVVNPDTVEAQVESGIVYGLSAALYGEISIKGGRAEQSNFHDYPLLGLKHMPVVETHIVPSGDFWGGVGEPPLPPIAPALCNALYAGSGRFIDSLPLRRLGLSPV
jgi:isoquinoline 1-oxidoreductase beta subunit